MEVNAHQVQIIPKDLLSLASGAFFRVQDGYPGWLRKKQ